MRRLDGLQRAVCSHFDPTVSIRANSSRSRCGFNLPDSGHWFLKSYNLVAAMRLRLVRH